MFKLTLKLLVLTLLLTVGLVFVSGSRASAAPLADNCSAAPYNDWGYTNGSGSLPTAMSSLMVRAVDTSTGNAPLNTNYVLNSQEQNGNNAYLDQRIFQWPPGAAGRDSQHQFSTGEHLSGTTGAEQSSCNGWSVLGPGIPGYVGNGYVLDCGASGGEGNVNFWISHVDNPGNAPGTWALYNTTGGGRSIITSDVNNDHGAHVFTEDNGNNISLRLEWTPAPTPQPSKGVCNYLHISETSPDSGSNGNTARVAVYASGVPGIGSPAYVPNSNGGTGSTNWNFYPTANSIDVVEVLQWDKPNAPNKGWHNELDANGNAFKYYLKSDGTFAAVTYTNSGGSWSEDPHPTINCFSAQCSISYVDGDGPGGIVQAGHPMHVHGIYTNTSPPPSNLHIWSPALDLEGSQNPGNNGTHTLWGSPPPAYTGYGYGFDLYLTAPSSVTTDNFSLTPVYYGGAAIGSACNASATTSPGGCPGVCVSQQFSATVSAQSNPSPTIENPTSDSYGATITHQWVNPPAGLPGHGINNPVSASFYQKKAGGGQTTPCSPPSYSSSGPYNVPSPSPPGYDTIWSNNCAIAPGSFSAGDEFCSTISATYSGGYLEPDGNVAYGTGPATDTNCPRVANEPYFKTLNSDISAGGDFDQCTTNGGTLAGYADISDPAGATRGASSQLSALALIKITGVASAQTPGNITGSPTKLSFANTGVQVDATGNESPVLGGQFGGCRTLTNEAAPASAQNLAGSSTSAVPLAGSGAYTHTGNLTITGGPAGGLGRNQNVSMFVTGDVYISGDITYGNGWDVGTAPSLIVHATGNIYIAPGVTQLTGVYIAQQQSDGSHGKIYTCADSTGFAPMSAVNVYNGCKNQLIVYGSFVADQINLMRSFGSLRDETPNPGPPAVAAGSQIGLVWQHQPPNPPNMNCTTIDEPSDPNTWNDNILCVPNSSSLQLAWTNAANASSAKLTVNGKRGKLCRGSITQLNCLQTKGYPYCTQWDVSSADPHSWGDNWLCSNQNAGLNFSLTNDPSKFCTPIIEISDPDGNWASSGYFLCEPKASAGSPAGSPTITGPPFSGCSNKGTQIDNISCAGEIFEYSPALYLSNGGGTTGAAGGGALQLQSITSLPPVL